MPAPLMVGMTPDIEVSAGYTIRITALDATTGNVVAGVNVSSAYLMGIDNSGQDQNPQDLAPSPLLVPADEAA